jgi:chromosome segregation ATPase
MNEGETVMTAQSTPPAGPSLGVEATARERIIAAAEALVSEGTKPTVEAVRQRSRASMNAVVEAMREWRAAREQAREHAERPQVPEQVAQAALDAAGRAYALGRDEARQEALTALQAAESERDDARGELTEAASAYDELEQARAVVVGDLDTVTHALAGAQATIEAQRVEIDRLRAEVAAERLRADAGEQNAAAARADAGAVREQAEAQRVEIDRLRAEVAQVRTHATADAKAAADTLATQRTRADRAEAVADELRKTVESLTAQRDRLQTSLDTAYADALAAAQAARAEVAQVLTQTSGTPTEAEATKTTGRGRNTTK